MTDLLIGLGLEPAVIGPWITALGWALVHFVWQGALIGGVFAIGAWLLRGGRPEYRYWLGLISLAAMVLAPVVTFLLLLGPKGSMLFVDGTSLQAWSDPAFAAVTSGAGLTREAFSLSLEQALPWVVGSWVLGVLIMSTRVGINWVRLLRLSRIGTRQISAELSQRVESLKECVGVNRAVRVLETTVAEVPTVLGWLRPVILLPTSSLVGLSPAQLDLVIAHELGHIRRLDYLVNLFQVLVETLLFYHPLVRWVSRRVREEREQCCDDLVIAACGNRIQYARALANLESMRSPELQPALAATGGQLVQRIERIVCTHQQRETFSANSGLLVVVVGLLVLAAQLADPMGVFEDRRARLADALTSELRAEQALGEASYVPLAEARVMPEEVELAAVPAATALAAEATPAPAARNASPRPVPDRGMPLSSAPARSRSAPPEQPVTDRDDSTRTSAAAPMVAPEVKPWTPTVNYENAVAAPSMPQSSGLQSGVTELTAKPAEPTLAQRDPAPVVDQAAGPVAIRRISPDYPVRARISGQQGYVDLEFSVTRDGRVADVRVRDSWPRRVFDRSAKRAIKGWRFDPATVSGGEVLNQRFEFTLAGNEAPVSQRDACLPLTGTRICRHDSPTALMAEAANRN